MVTMKQWNESKQDFGEFMHNKPLFDNLSDFFQEIDEEIFIYFLEVLPPLSNNRYKSFLCSEPVNHINGVPIYFAFSQFIDVNGVTKYFYRGLRNVKFLNKDVQIDNYKI